MIKGSGTDLLTINRNDEGTQVNEYEEDNIDVDASDDGAHPFVTKLPGTVVIEVK